MIDTDSRRASGDVSLTIRNSRCMNDDVDWECYVHRFHEERRCKTEKSNEDLHRTKLLRKSKMLIRTISRASCDESKRIGKILADNFATERDGW